MNQTLNINKQNLDNVIKAYFKNNQPEWNITCIEYDIYGKDIFDASVVIKVVASKAHGNVTSTFEQPVFKDQMDDIIKSYFKKYDPSLKVEKTSFNIGWEQDEQGNNTNKLELQGVKVFTKEKTLYQIKDKIVGILPKKNDNFDEVIVDLTNNEKDERSNS